MGEEGNAAASSMISIFQNPDINPYRFTGSAIESIDCTENVISGGYKYNYSKKYLKPYSKKHLQTYPKKHLKKSLHNNTNTNHINNTKLKLKHNKNKKTKLNKH